MAAMRYYFHIRAKEGLVPDDDGMEFDTVDAAREEALQSRRELSRESWDTGPQGRLLSIDVVDQTGTVIFSLPMHSGAPRTLH